MKDYKITDEKTKKEYYIKTDDSCSKLTWYIDKLSKEIREEENKRFKNTNHENEIREEDKIKKDLKITEDWIKNYSKSDQK